MSHRFLEGKSIYLSPHDLADIDTYLKWFNDPEVKQTLLLRHAVTRQAEEEFLRKAGNPPHFNFFAIHMQSNDQLVGTCDLKVAGAARQSRHRPRREEQMVEGIRHGSGRASIALWI